MTKKRTNNNREASTNRCLSFCRVLFDSLICFKNRLLEKYTFLILLKLKRWMIKGKARAKSPQRYCGCKKLIWVKLQNPSESKKHRIARLYNQVMPLAAHVLQKLLLLLDGNINHRIVLHYNIPSVRFHIFFNL